MEQIAKDVGTSKKETGAKGGTHKKGTIGRAFIV